MPEVATREPLEFRAGDTVTWRREDLTGDYPAPTWTLTYYFRGPSQPADIVASADDEQFEVTIAAATTANWNAGVYSWLARVSKSGEVHAVGDGQCTVLKNLAADTADYDGRSFSAQMLEIIEQRLLGKSLTAIAAATGSSTAEIESYSIGNRSIAYAKRTELLQMRRELKSELIAQEKRAKVEHGEPSSNQIFVRFTPS